MNLPDEDTMIICARWECEIDRDAAVRTRAHTEAHGFSILEIVVALSVVLLALTIAYPMLNPPGSSPQSLAADLQDLSLNLQVARDLGISRGAHYRVRITSQTAYTLDGPDVLGGSGWATERRLSLRPNVRFAGADVGKVAEFDMRGLCVSSPLPTFTLTDLGRGWSKQVTVSAQGMVDHT
jgi:prepilin-type N-terminal cleavage/methylation domain-containing protein